MEAIKTATATELATREQCLILQKPSGKTRALQIMGRFEKMNQTDESVVLVDFRANGQVPMEIIQRHMKFQTLDDEKKVLIKAHYCEGERQMIGAAIFEGGPGFVKWVKMVKANVRYQTALSFGLKATPKLKNYVHSSDKVEEAKEEVANWKDWIAKSPNV